MYYLDLFIKSSYYGYNINTELWQLYLLTLSNLEIKNNILIIKFYNYINNRSVLDPK